jgi:hypothetical protein
MLNFLKFILWLGCIWDFFTSASGIAGILGLTDFNEDILLQSLFVIITAGIVGGFIVGMNINSREIWSDYSNKKFWEYMRIPHIITTLFDAYTSFVGTAQYVILQKTYGSTFISIGLGEVVENTTLQQLITIFVVTLIVTSSGIIISFLND